jgi:retron-type reverse transcriptase
MSGLEGKPFAIPKQLVWQAWKSVKANGGAAGADGVTVEAFGKDLKNNLYKVWNRMCVPRMRKVDGCCAHLLVAVLCRR